MDELTLAEHASLSLQERASDLTARTGDLFSKEFLRSIYSDAKVRKKVIIKRPKEVGNSNNALMKREIERKHLYERFNYCLNRGYRIIFLDETWICNTDYKMRSWNLPNKNTEVIDPQHTVKNHTAIVAIDRCGLVHHKVIQGWNNADTFLDFLNDLQAKVKDERVALFIDNCAVHHAKKVKWRIVMELKWILIYNIAYKPQFMPIELYFA